jgi:transglutaminase-like putative cysteine protease
MNLEKLRLLIRGIIKDTVATSNMLLSEPKIFLGTFDSFINVVAMHITRSITSFLNTVGNSFMVSHIGFYNNLHDKLYSNKKKYLRPTLLCESEDPSIIALSHRLGAYEKSEIEYANDCFEWVKRNIKFRVVAYSRGANAVLLDGHGGMCGDKEGLFIALCRAGGIKARYILYPLGVTELYPLGVAGMEYEKHNLSGGKSKAFKRYAKLMLHEFMGHTVAEIWINGRWMTADPTFSPEYEATLNIPISKLGEDVSSWSYKTSKSIRYEEKPWVDFFGGKINNLTITKLLDRMNCYIIRSEKKGKKILEKMGEEEYDRKTRKRYEYLGPKIMA